MKKILNALFLTLLTVFTFSSCSDVPAPYDILGEGDVPGLTGDGTKENPYNIEAAQQKQDGSIAWVQGYIVGAIENYEDPSGSAKFGAPFTAKNNLLIAASATETNVKNCVCVQLSSGTELYSKLNLAENATNLGHILAIQGSLEKFYGFPGVKSTTAATLDGKDVGGSGETDPDNPLGLDDSNPVNSFSATFDDAVNNNDYLLANWYNVAVIGGRRWQGKVFNADKYIQATSYNASGSSFECWFVTPAFKVDEIADKTVSFKCAVYNYATAAANSNLEVYFLKLVNGKMESNKLTIDGMPTTDNTWVSLEAKLDSYAGQTGFVGFKYTSTSSTDALSYRLDDIQAGKGQGGGEVPEPDPEENSVFTETFGAVVGANTNVADFTGWDNANFTFTVADPKCNIRAKAHMTEANRTEQTKVNSIWFPAKFDHTFTISGIDASKYSKFIVKYELGANVFSEGNSIDLNVLKVSLDGVEGTAASKVVSKDNNDANVFFDMQVELSVQGTANSTLKFSATGTDNTMGLLLYNVRLIGVKGEGGDPEPGDADGTEAHPYSAADVITLNSTQKGPFYVKAYIVGAADGAMSKIQTSNFSVDTNIVIADKQGETEVSKLVPVQLPSGAIRTAWALKTNPDKLGKQVIIQANLENYFSTPGLKSPTSITEVGK